MKTTKHILSVLILFSIFGGIAHNLFPHCEDLILNDSYSNKQSEYHHHKHHADLDNEPHFNIKHIKHNNHLDEGIYDYVKCILVDIEIPQDNCNLSCFVFWIQKGTLKNDLQYPINKNIVSVNTNQNNILISFSLFTTFRINIYYPPILDRKSNPNLPII